MVILTILMDSSNIKKFGGYVIMKKFLLGLIIFISTFTWELFQNILGFLVFIFTCLNSIGTKKLKIEWYKGEIVLLGNFFSAGVSLGRFIILDRKYENYILFGVSQFGMTVKHEYGHSRQSLMLGPLYIFVVGIPSALHNIYNRGLYKQIVDPFERRAKKYEEYYNWYCEKWADKLGDVHRVYSRI